MARILIVIAAAIGGVLLLELPSFSDAVKVEWGDWTDWPECPVTCGGAEILRIRKCITPGVKRDRCFRFRKRQCAKSRCPTEDQVSDMKPTPEPTTAVQTQENPKDVTPRGLWSACDAPCGGGKRYHTRKCAVHSGNLWCKGLTEESCNTHTCSADIPPEEQRTTKGEGNEDMTAWGEWSVCEALCGGGKRYRTRECIKASSKLECEAVEEESCNTQPCSADMPTGEPGITDSYGEGEPKPTKPTPEGTPYPEPEGEPEKKPVEEGKPEGKPEKTIHRKPKPEDSPDAEAVVPTPEGPPEPEGEPEIKPVDEGKPEGKPEKTIHRKPKPEDGPDAEAVVPTPEGPPEPEGEPEKKPVDEGKPEGKPEKASYGKPEPEDSSDTKAAVPTPEGPPEPEVEPEKKPVGEGKPEGKPEKTIHRKPKPEDNPDAEAVVPTPEGPPEPEGEPEKKPVEEGKPEGKPEKTIHRKPKPEDSPDAEAVVPTPEGPPEPEGEPEKKPDEEGKPEGKPEKASYGKPEPEDSSDIKAAVPTPEGPPEPESEPEKKPVEEGKPEGKPEKTIHRKPEDGPHAEAVVPTPEGPPEPEGEPEKKPIEEGKPEGKPEKASYGKPEPEDSSDTKDMTAWGEWSVCEALCGGGKRYRTRECIKASSKLECEAVEEESCNTQPCSADMPTGEPGITDTYGEGEPKPTPEGTPYRPEPEGEPEKKLVEEGKPEGKPETTTHWKPEPEDSSDAEPVEPTLEGKPEPEGEPEKKPVEEGKPEGKPEKTIHREPKPEDSPDAEEYSEWTEWTRCDVQCGGGKSYRTRECSDETGKEDCEDAEEMPCNTQGCPDDTPIGEPEVTVDSTEDTKSAPEGEPESRPEPVVDTDDAKPSPETYPETYPEGESDTKGSDAVERKDTDKDAETTPPGRALVEGTRPATVTEIDVEPEKQENEFCGESEIGASIYLYYTAVSPGFPRNYSGGLDCMWTLFAPENYRVELVIDRFEADPGDKFTILEGRPREFLYKEARIVTMRGVVQPGTVYTSVGRYMTIRLQTRKNTYGGTYSIRFKAILNEIDVQPEKQEEDEEEEAWYKILQLFLTWLYQDERT